MKRFLLVVLLAATTTSMISCNNDSGPSKPAPKPGKDGVNFLGNANIIYGNQNEGQFDIEKGKDLVVAMAFPLGDTLKGRLVLTEAATDVENQIAKIPKPISDKDQAALDTLCFLSNTPHRWFLRANTIDTLVSIAQPLDFDYDTVLYLEVETRDMPKCEHVFFNFKSELLNSERKPEPSPTATPTPTPTPEPTPVPILDAN